MKEKIKNIFSSKVFSPFWNILFKNKAMVFMLHRVSPIDNTRLSPNENMKVSPKYLESFIIDCIDKGYEFISLDTLAELLDTNKSLSKKIVLTLDDGYADNYTHAYPLLKKYNVPFTIYLSTAFINGEQFPWWYKLEYLLLQKNDIIFNNSLLSATSLEEKNILFTTIRNDFIEIEPEMFSNLFDFFLNNNNYNNRFEENMFLSWDEIKKMASDPLVTIANHGYFHYRLVKMKEEDIKQEFLIAQNQIMEKVGKIPKHICYSYGDANEIVFKSIKELNVKTGTCLKAGVVSHKYKNHKDKLPRFYLLENLNIDKILSLSALQTRFLFRNGIN